VIITLYNRKRIILTKELFPMKIHKLLSILLTVLMISMITVGCKPEAPAAPKDYIYKMTEFVPTGETYDYLGGVDYYGETVYMLTSGVEAADGGEATNSYLYKTDLSGAVIEKILLSSDTEAKVQELGHSTYYSGVTVGSDGSVYLLRSKSGSFTAEDGSITEGTVTDIVRLDGETQTAVLNISDRLTALGMATSVYGFAIDEENVSYTTINMDSVWAFNLDTGETVLENQVVPGGVGGYGGNFRGFYKNADGEMCVVSYGNIEENGTLVDKLIITPINTDTHAYGMSESIDAPGGIQSYIGNGDSTYDYYGFSPSSIYGYKDGVKTLVADLPASGVNLNQLSLVIPINETTFIMRGTTPESIVIEKLFKLTKVDPKDVPDRTIVTVAALEDELYLSGYITEFMLSHPQYQVEYKLYAEDTGTSYEKALENFNMDIIAGNVPDVILISPQMTYGNYVNKGIFADLYPFIDKDPDVSRETYHEPFLKVLETDGKLYSMAAAFQIYTLVGKTSIFGEAQGQSLAELQAAADKIPGATLFGNINRNDFRDGFFGRMARRFIDDVEGKASFDSPEFIELLEYMKSLPEPSSDEQYINYAWAPDETGDYKEDRTLIQILNTMDFRDIVSMEKVDFGTAESPAAVTFLGYPNADSADGTLGTGITARARMEVAVLDKAKNPDGAWEFVKGLMAYGDPFLESIGYPPLWFFPLINSELDIAAKNATVPAFQYDFITGERIDRLQWLGPNLTEIQPNNTEADNAKMYALFESIERIDRSIPAISTIISEEANAYLTGNRSAKETAEIIQNRATTYLEESK
jgi:hypothetical protein